MPRLPKNKVLVGVYLPRELVKELRELVKMKYEGLYGLSLEVEQAIRYWLRKEKMEKNIKPPNPNPKIYLIKEQIKKYLMDKYGYIEFTSVPYKHLEEAICVIRGYSRKTVKTWIDRLEKFHCIKWRSHNLVEIL